MFFDFFFKREPKVGDTYVLKPEYAKPKWGDVLLINSNVVNIVHESDYDSSSDPHKLRSLDSGKRIFYKSLDYKFNHFGQPEAKLEEGSVLTLKDFEKYFEKNALVKRGVYFNSKMNKFIKSGKYHKI